MRKESTKNVIDSNVKTAILFLTSKQMPEVENFDFVLTVMQAFEDIEEVRKVLYENYFEEILDWWEQ